MKGIFCNPICTIFNAQNKYKNSDAGTISTIADEGLYGNSMEILEESDGWYHIETSYGYKGYVEKENVMLGSIKNEGEGNECEVNGNIIYEGNKYMMVIRNCLDILSIPIVQGICLITLFRGSIIQVMSDECSVEGWIKVKLLDGNEGFVRKIDLSNIKVSPMERGQSFCSYFNELLYENYWGYEKLWRGRLVETAMGYLGTQYRWGGKTPLGIDCSGLVFMTYWLNGVTIWRDAQIKEGYPIQSLSMGELRIGDLLFFPGHVAMYIGKHEYIHSTGNVQDGGVVINSLKPNSQNFRRDLKESLYAIGGIRC